ncbi:PREDICTED: transcription factor 21-like [Pterocles gutturalis]|uniref:transcription factor 21-like n=1 Tax=Pterocles gutturalis TaxID=240206 RepID=UPI000528744C|nr:PREDICTED: transcription factor 21-like [Pterocles gutturalis]
MSTGSLSDVEDLQEVEMLECDGLKMDTNKEFGASNESNEEGSNGENGSPQKGRGASGKRKKAPPKKSPLNGVSQEGKQVQRNAANARERARMRVLSKAFSRLKTTLPWVPPDTKLSKLDTLRLASSYIAHLRQILANDKYENGYIHPVNLVSHSPPGPGTLPASMGRGTGMGHVQGDNFAVLLTESLVPAGWQGALCEGTGSQLPSHPVPQEMSLPDPIRCSWQSPPGDRRGPRWP